MAGFTQDRVLKGVRAGGQFAHARHSERTLTLTAPAPVSEPARTLPQPSHEDLADAAHIHLLTSLRQAQQLTPMDRALAAYATRTHRSGTWEDYIPELHDRMPNREELMAAMRAFEEAPIRQANTPSVKAAAAAMAIIERRKTDYLAKRRAHERSYGSLAGFTERPESIAAERAAPAAAAPAVAG